MNIENVFLAIKLATNNETGVITTTTSVIFTFIVSINISVPAIVSTPEKNCVNPIKRPSANWSTSAITRLTISPYDCASIYLRGSFCNFSIASSLISLVTW